jgi:ketosteroid isomerase-like protein
LIGRSQVEDWLSRYEAAWRTAGTEPLRELFTEDATYSMSPYEERLAGLAEIAEIWEAERQSPDEAFTMTSEIVAVDGDTAVVRLEVGYGEPLNREYRDLWVIGFAEDGRAAAFEEWPSWPGQPYAATGN